MSDQLMRLEVLRPAPGNLPRSPIVLSLVALSPKSKFPRQEQPREYGVTKLEFRGNAPKLVAHAHWHTDREHDVLLGFRLGIEMHGTPRPLGFNYDEVLRQLYIAGW